MTNQAPKTLSYDQARKQALKNEERYYCPDCHEEFPGVELDGHYFSCASNTKGDNFVLLPSSDDEAEQEWWPSEQFPDM